MSLRSGKTTAFPYGIPRIMLVRKSGEADGYSVKKNPKRVSIPTPKAGGISPWARNTPKTPKTPKKEDKENAAPTGAASRSPSIIWDSPEEKVNRKVATPFVSPLANRSAVSTRRQSTTVGNDSNASESESGQAVKNSAAMQQPPPKKQRAISSPEEEEEEEVAVVATPPTDRQPSLPTPSIDARFVLVNTPIIYQYPHQKKGSKKRITYDKEGELDDHRVIGEIDFEIDCIVAANGPHMLVKWTGLKHSTWFDALPRGSAVQSWLTRRKVVELAVDGFYASICPNRMEMARRFPNMVIQMTSPKDRYIVNPGIRYLTGLRMYELETNKLLKENGIAPLYFEDHTSFEDSELPADLTVDYTFTKKGREIMEGSDFPPMACSCTDINCAAIKNENDACCAKSSPAALGFNHHGVLANLFGTQQSLDNEFNVDIIECGDDCACGPKCKNRTVQNGRQIPLVVIRSEKIGWCTYTPVRIPVGSFVCVYYGKVLYWKEAEHVSNVHYLLDVAVRYKGQSDEITIDAANEGSEAKFISHSCVPNLFPFRVVYRKNGRNHRVTAMFAVKDIEIGEQLTFDYFNNTPLEEARRLCPFECMCGHGVRCKFNPEYQPPKEDDDCFTMKKPKGKPGRKKGSLKGAATRN